MLMRKLIVYVLFTFQFGHLVFVKHFYEFCHKLVKRCSKYKVFVSVFSRANIGGFVLRGTYLIVLGVTK